MMMEMVNTKERGDTMWVVVNSAERGDLIKQEMCDMMVMMVVPIQVLTPRNE